MCTRAFIFVHLCHHITDITSSVSVEAHICNFSRSLSDFEMLVREPLTVQLAFNVSQREKRGRRYVLGGGEPDYFRLVSVMQPVLEAHAKSALLLSTLQCIKCQVQFTMDSPGNSGE